MALTKMPRALIDRVRESVAQDPAASLCVRCILVRDGRRTLVATMVRMVQLAGERGSVQASPQLVESPEVTCHVSVPGLPASLRASSRGPRSA